MNNHTAAGCAGGRGMTAQPNLFEAAPVGTIITQDHTHWRKESDDLWRAEHTSEYTTDDRLNTFEYPTEIVRWGDGQ